MKRISLLIIILAVHSIYSQTQPVIILSHKWYEKKEIKMIRVTDTFITGPPNPTTSGVSKENPEVYKPQSINKYFEYEIVIKNNSSQKIIGIGLDYIFLDSDSKTERGRKNFLLNSIIKPNKKQTLTGRTNNPPIISIDAKDYEQGAFKGKELIEVNCVVFQNGTIWKRLEIDEKVCESLKTTINSRKKN